MTELLNSFPDFSDSFSDKRIGKRANQVLHKLNLGRTSSLRQISQSDAEQKSFYRLFNNESFTEEGITEAIIKRCSALCCGRHVLAIQDTTEFNLSGQKGRLKPNSGLGKTAKNDVLGFLLHSSLIVDAARTTALGYSSIQLWHRQADSPDRHQRDYQQLPVEQKESYKWIAATHNTQELLSTAEQITIVADRESDIYDLLAAPYGANVFLLLRSNFNRLLLSGRRLQEHLADMAVMHEYELELNGDIRKGIARRKVPMQLKWDRVELVKPKRCKDQGLADSVAVYVVEASEKKGGGILWRLYTTHPVNSVQDALSVIEWYKQRWHIEQIHRLLKTEGFRLERSQLEKGWAVRKLTLLAMMATLRILQMMLAYGDESTQVAVAEVFNEGEQSCLEMINTAQQGNTEKRSNPWPSSTLRWATWIIARLGGWKGYGSQRRPGPIVLQKGLAKFYAMLEGWKLYQAFLKNVSTQ